MASGWLTPPPSGLFRRLSFQSSWGSKLLQSKTFFRPCALPGRGRKPPNAQRASSVAPTPEAPLVVYVRRAGLKASGLRTRRRGRGRRLHDVARLALFDDAHLALGAFVVRVSDDHSDVDDRAVGEDEVVVRGGVGREPELAVYLLAVGLEDGEALLAFGHALAAHFDDLQVAVVNPHAPLKEAFALLLRHPLRRHVEDVCVQLVHLLRADVCEVVLIYLRGFEREGLDAAEVFEVFVREGDFAERRDGKVRDALEAVARVVEGELRRALVLARDLAADADGLDERFTRERVAVERAPKLRLLRREGADYRGHVNGFAACARLALPRRRLAVRRERER